MHTPLEDLVNAALDEDIACIQSSSYDTGWIFALRGEPGAELLDVDGYASFLEATIDRMMGAEG